MAFGFYATLGDLAKIAQLYHARGQHNGVQILHAGKTEEILPGMKERGLSTGYMARSAKFTMYFRSFWSVFFDSEEGCQLYIPQMLGWGGNIVSLMPGGVTGIRLAKSRQSSGGAFDTFGMMKVGDRLVRFCE
jgi:CubicO group peptidase (beta-lactamase class C family)